MPEHPYGWLSLAPPVVAVVLAIVTRKVLISLLAGLAVGALITRHWAPLPALIDLFEVHLWPTLIEPSKLRVFSFTLLMGATVGVIYRSGGMRGLVEAVTPLARTRRSGQFATWLMGLLVFFDDYANSLLLGSTLQPICDRLRISREKLAYLVDSTAAPVAGLAVVSTWIAVELDYIREGLDGLAPPEAQALNPFGLFLSCIPYRFYVIQTLLFVPMVALLRRDFGPMRKAELRVLRGESLQGSDAAEALKSPYGDEEIRSSHWTNAAIPLLITLGVILGLIIATGRAALTDTAAVETMSTFSYVQAVVGAADSSLALTYGGLAGLIVAALFARVRIGLSTEEVWDAIGRGAKVVLPAIAILWLAGAMSRMTGNKSINDAPASYQYEFKDYRLYTGDFLKEKLLEAGEARDSNFAAWLPTVVFLLSAVIAFCTGTSFGTMGIIVPMVIPLGWAAVSATGVANVAESPVFLCSLGSVLAGAVFGDHCSPLSDTTILSSQASGCNHMAHVATQMPYALVPGLASILLGTALVGHGVSVWILLPLQTAALLVTLLLLGKRVDEE